MLSSTAYVVDVAVAVDVFVPVVVISGKTAVADSSVSSSSEYAVVATVAVPVSVVANSRAVVDKTLA